jgi:hypothetical protein
MLVGTFLFGLGSNDRVSQISLHGAVGGGLLLGLLRLRWKLQNSCLLAFYQRCQKNDFAVWELKRIVMGVPLVFIDLSEDRGPVGGHRVIPRARPLRPSPNRGRKGQLSARQETDGHIALSAAKRQGCQQQKQSTPQGKGAGKHQNDPHSGEHHSR